MMNYATKPLPRAKSVLVASDDPVALTLLTERLSTAGNSVRTADTPGGVLLAMHRDMPDLVLLQPGPRFSGAVLYERLRTHPATRVVPVLLVAPLSALDKFPIKPEAEHYAKQPIRLDALASRVQGLLQTATSGAAELAPPAA